MLCLRSAFTFIALTLLLTGYSARGFAQVPGRIIEMAPKSVVEVIIPKMEDKDIKYERQLPMNKIPFKQRTDTYFSIGTAFFVTPTKLVSAAHVFDLHERKMTNDYLVRTMDGQVYKIAHITKYSGYRDIIEFTLQKYPPKIQPLKMGRTFTLGENVCAPGNAIGEGISFRCGGQISSTNPEERDGLWDDIRFSTPVSPGNSGGPLLNESGQVVGVVVKRSFNENLNVAIPINEYIKLTDKKAEFSIKDLTIKESTGLLTKQDWEFTTPLPDTPVNINHAAYKDINRLYDTLVVKHHKDYANQLFPDHKMFRTYLKAQDSDNSYFSIITTKDKNLANWGTDSGKFQFMRIGIEQELKIQTIARHFFFILDKPKDMPLKQFLDDPKNIINTASLYLGFARSIGDEEVKISSFGDPLQVAPFRDKLNRPWTSYTWFTRYDRSYIQLTCSPLPKGVACLLDNNPIQNLTDYTTNMMRDGLDETLFGYVGSLEHWQEYLTMDHKYLPPIFYHSKVTRDKEKLAIHLDDFDFSFKLLQSGDEQDLLEVRVGYSPFERLALTALGIYYAPILGLSEGIYLQKVYQPDPFQSPSYRMRVAHLFKGLAPYDGKVHQQENSYYVEKLMKPFDGKMATKVYCSVPLHEDGAKALGYCQSLQ